MSVPESFNNQTERKMNDYLSERHTFALETFQSVTQRRGLRVIIINKVKRYEKD